jgi:hypothetical protein
MIPAPNNTPIIRQIIAAPTTMLIVASAVEALTVTVFSFSSEIGKSTNQLIDELEIQSNNYREISFNS